MGCVHRDIVAPERTNGDWGCSPFETHQTSNQSAIALALVGCGAKGQGQVELLVGPEDIGPHLEGLFLGISLGGTVEQVGGQEKEVAVQGEQGFSPTRQSRGGSAGG
jgi:hypothetical protein